ncbi:hypothetical protein [Actinoplanes sp. NPDC051494]|uniref:hypothetical protein n=1 Tax=Actinoplanes sp. NPDC051494 TaxID=3363907 RepID=UPI0037972FCF
MLSPDQEDRVGRQREDREPSGSDQEFFERYPDAEAGEFDDGDEETEDHAEERGHRIFREGDDGHQADLRVAGFDQVGQEDRRQRHQDCFEVDVAVEALLGPGEEVQADPGRDEPDDRHEEPDGGCADQCVHRQVPQRPDEPGHRSRAGRHGRASRHGRAGRG